VEASDEAAIRAAPERRQAEEWALVLAAAGLPHRVVPTGVGWALLVPAPAAAEARAALDAYERDAREAPEEPAPPEYGPSAAGLVVAVLLLAFHALAGPADRAGAWGREGRAAAARIRAGEGWRTVTALTLHANGAHVAGNAAGAAVFVGALARAVGPGVAVAVALGSGVAGNAANAALRPPRHQSVGASTAVFGALGALGGLAAGRRRGRAARGRRPWLAVAATLALLGLLGTGERADLVAHLFGLVAGALGGAGLARLRGVPGPGVQATLVVAAAATVVGAWLWAFAAG
jgi:membrane associated rhomboid family serine protease